MVQQVISTQTTATYSHHMGIALAVHDYTTITPPGTTPTNTQLYSQSHTE